ncbi:MAG: lipid II:glycine glycyltransferase FemX [Christensenellales bacterium]|jgi:hypothetical protein
MLKVFTIEQAREWDEIVDSFQQRDAYYYSGYQKAFMLHGDGSPMLFYYEDKNTRAINVAMKRDIAKDKLFRELEENKYFDLASPYGYGGFVIEGENIDALNEEYRKYCKENFIISEFVRCHPVLDNQTKLSNMYDIVELGPTITMDLSDKEIIWQNIHSKNRNVIRKAQKEGVEIKQGNTQELYDAFIEMYNKTMDKNEAANYYYFERKFYDSIREDFADKSTLFYALYEGEIIAMSIMLFANMGMHYHLSAFDMEYRDKAATNLLLYEAACWGNDRGYKTFHLGGGVGSKEDSLYSFKKAFNKNSNTRFAIGKKIFDKDVYEQLVETRKREYSFDKESSFFPLYRA